MKDGGAQNNAPDPINPAELKQFKGIHHFEDLGVETQGTYSWVFPVISTPRSIRGDELRVGTAPEAADAENDTLMYSFVNGTLSVMGTDGNDSIAVNDLGGNRVQLLRSTQLPDGSMHTDPVREFEDVIAIRVDMKKGDDRYSMSQDLAINTSILGGDGFDTISTGAGQDIVDAGTGNGMFPLLMVMTTSS